LFGEGLGLDSVDALELALALQKRYAIRIESIRRMRASTSPPSPVWPPSSTHSGRMQKLTHPAAAGGVLYPFVVYFGMEKVPPPMFALVLGAIWLIRAPKLLRSLAGAGWSARRWRIARCWPQRRGELAALVSHADQRVVAGALLA
jgi:hypothetical protein